MAKHEFSPIELYRLSEGIEGNVDTINSGLRSLEKMMKLIGGAHDDEQLRQKILKTQRTVNGLVPGTARDIRRLDATARHGDQLQKLQVERLTQAFRDALAKYSTVQKEVTEKMTAHVPLPARTRNNPGGREQQAIADDDESSLLANEQAQAHLVEDTRLLLENEVYINRNDPDVVGQTMLNPTAVVLDYSQTVNPESHIGAASADVEAGNNGLAVEQRHMSTQKTAACGGFGFAFLSSIIISILIFLRLIQDNENKRQMEQETKDYIHRLDQIGQMRFGRQGGEGP